MQTTELAYFMKINISQGSMIQCITTCAQCSVRIRFKLTTKHVTI
jgi:hypothetical protein